MRLLLCFNPCFIGCYSLTERLLTEKEESNVVSILVLLDVTL